MLKKGHGISQGKEYMAERLKNMAGEAYQSPDTATTIPQTENIRVKSPIPGISPELFQTLNQRHSPEFIEEQRGKYPTHEAFLEAAEKEAEHIRLTLAQKDKPKVEQVMANAALPEEERLQEAEKLLGPLSDIQKTTLKRMHEVGLNEPGKDESHTAGVYNYTQRQIAEKARIGAEKTETGEKVFSKGERRKLFEAGITGVLPLDAIDLDPATYEDPNDSTNRRLTRFTTEVRRRGDAGQADENYLRSKATQLSQMYIEGTVDETQALDVLDRLEGWVLEAERPPGPSLFEQTLVNIAFLKDPNNPDPDRLTKLNQEVENLNQLERVANTAGLFQAEKPELYDLLRGGRIDLSIRERREGRTFLRDITNAKIRSEQATVESGAFWNDPSHPERRQLRAELGGAVDYFRRASVALIDSVARKPLRPLVNGSLNILDDRDYSDIRAEYVGLDGVMDAWIHEWEVNSKGIVRPESSDNFEDLRKKLEKERQERPRFMKHPYYGSVEFFADNMSELGLATRDFVKHTIDSLPRGESKVMMQKLQREQEAANTAYADAVLFFERDAREAVVKWTSSEMNSSFSMSAIGDSQRTGAKGVESGGFKYFTDSWAEGLRKTKTSVNYEDALTLDEEGMFLYIAERLCENDGEFYRFGSNSPEFPSDEEEKEYLDNKRAEIIADAASHRLRSMDENDLLKTFDANDAANPLNLTDPRQPEDPYFQVQQIFRKLKITFDEIDAKTTRLGGTVTKSKWDMYVEQHKDSIPLHRAFAQVKANCDWADARDELKGKVIIEKRWDIYKRETKAWEDFARLGKADNRDPKAKVKFVHPLARNWRSDQEFFDMYEEMDPSDKAVIGKRKERAEYLLDMAENYLRFNMIDVRSGSARIHFRKEVILNGRQIPEDTVEVYTNVLRDELKEVMALDENKSPLDKRFKVTYILRKMGYQPEMPAYGMFTLGADDTVRNRSIVKHFKEEPEFKELFDEVARSKIRSDKVISDYRASLKRKGMGDADIDADLTLKFKIKLQKFVDDRLFRGSNAKTIIVKFAEDERLAVQAVQRAIRHPDNKKYGNSGGDYDNFPGTDNESEEGGVKYWKNHLYPDYGTSRGTVRVNGMIPFINFGVLDRFSEVGGWTPKYITGLRHRGDEIELAEEGSLLIDPKDTQDYLTRLESVVKKRPLWVSAGDAEKKPGALMGGIFSGMFKLRELGERSDHFYSAANKDNNEKGMPQVIAMPELAWANIRESGKRAFLETMSAIVGPLEAMMRENRVLETGYGYAQGTSKDMNTILMNDIFYWMDNYWNEYQGDYGYAVDGMLHMGREVMYVYLKEEGLIWPEERIVADIEAPNATDIEGWKDISERLVKDLPEDLWNGVPVGSLMYPAKGSIKVKNQKSLYLDAPTREKVRVNGNPIEERDKILERLRQEITRQRAA